MNVPTLECWPRCIVRTYNSSHAAGLGATCVRDCIYGNCTFKTPLSCSWNWSISVTKGLTVSYKQHVTTETFWQAYSKTLHQRGFDSKREKIYADCYLPNTDKKGVNITFNYIVLTHLAALTPLSISSHYMVITGISLTLYFCNLMFFDRAS